MRISDWSSDVCSSDLSPDTGVTSDADGGPGACAVAATAVTNVTLQRVFVRHCRPGCPGRGLTRVIPALIWPSPYAAGRHRCTQRGGGMHLLQCNRRSGCARGRKRPSPVNAHAKTLATKIFSDTG